MITETGLDEISNVMGGQGTIPTYIGIGIGSSTVTSGQIALANETDRNVLTTIDVTDPKEVVYITDFSTTEISGTILTEFGLFNHSASGTMYERNVIGSIVFDGTNELQIQLNHRYSRA